MEAGGIEPQPRDRGAEVTNATESVRNLHGTTVSGAHRRFGRGSRNMALLTFVWVDSELEAARTRGFRGTPLASRASSLPSSASPTLDPSGFPRSRAPMARKPGLPGWPGIRARVALRSVGRRAEDPEPGWEPPRPLSTRISRRFTRPANPHERQERPKYPEKSRLPPEKPDRVRSKHESSRTTRGRFSRQSI
jgi:hypothetical protein